MDLDWMEPVAVEQGTERWLEWRKRGLGSSDAPVVMGVSPYKTPLQLWEEKTGETAESEAHFGMKRGHELEPIARAQYEKEYMEMPPTLVVHPDYDFIRASFDGLNVGGRRGLEVKCPNKEDHQLAQDGKIPAKYWPQVQHLLLAAPHIDQIDYYSFDGVSGVRVEVKRDSDYQHELLRELRAFWSLVQKKVPPMITAKDYVEETDYVNLENMAEWARKKKQVELLEGDMDELKEAVIKRMRHSRIRGAGVRVQKSVRKGSIDYAKIPEIKKMDLEVYRRPGTEYVSFSLDTKEG